MRKHPLIIAWAGSLAIAVFFTAIKSPLSPWPWSTTLALGWVVAKQMVELESEAPFVALLWRLAVRWPPMIGLLLITRTWGATAGTIWGLLGGAAIGVALAWSFAPWLRRPRDGARQSAF